MNAKNVTKKCEKTKMRNRKSKEHDEDAKVKNDEHVKTQRRKDAKVKNTTKTQDKLSARISSAMIRDFSFLVRR